LKENLAAQAMAKTQQISSITPSIPQITSAKTPLFSLETLKIFLKDPQNYSGHYRI
jgi:hypothetical protein